MILQNKVIIITGASVGIGKATAVTLASAGVNLLLVARREERLQTLMQQLAALPGKRLVVAADIRQENLAPHLVDQTVAEFRLARLGEKGVNHFGLQGVPAEPVAAKILSSIRHGCSEVFVIWYDWLFIHLNRLFLRLIDWLMTQGAHLA